MIRAGYGVSYTPFPDNTWMYNFPVRSNNSYVTPSGADTYGPAVLPGGQLASFEAGFPAPDSRGGTVERNHYQSRPDHCGIVRFP